MPGACRAIRRLVPGMVRAMKTTTTIDAARLERRVAKLEAALEGALARIAALEHQDDPAWQRTELRSAAPVPGWKPAPGWKPGAGITAGQLRALQAQCTQTGMSRPERIAWATAVLGREVESFKRLTRDEAATLLDRLSEQAA